MEQSSSSSKVTGVEYSDPSGVFQLLSPGLLARLPLRNLYWESHAGPLRSIDTLHVDLVAAATETNVSSASSTDLTRVKSADSSVSGDDGFKVQPLAIPGEKEKEESRSSTPRLPRERRHQIPGLRQTPYLKVFLLRCDDNEAYKQTARKQVRDWIKEHTPPQSSSKATAQENHDAFEWLIIHVIVPNTAAASQPRTSSKSKDSSSTSVEKSSRWLGSSSTIFEKLQSDFNSSSKSAIDRVAQIRIGVNDVPYDMLPRVVPAIPGSYTETPQDNENAWTDLMTKIKSLILSSFDLRVSQYEEDIKEKDAQRSLPGWNFCTFFVLKEGLARGFESVGLVEDALVGYDELALGLDSIVRDKAAGADLHGSSFLPWTDDLKARVEMARAALVRGSDDETKEDAPVDLQSQTTAEQEMAEIPLNSVKKPYRDLILSSNVSLFDFRCYLFSRQLTVLLRLANATSSQEELLAKLKEQRETSLQGVAARHPPTQPSEEPENLTALAEVCRRSLEFITSIARIMRDDILTYLASLHEKDDPQDVLKDEPRLAQLVENMVSSFTFSVAQQILAQTSTKSIPIPPSALTTSSELGQEPKSSIPEPKTMMHPARSSSLQPQAPREQPPSPGVFPGPNMKPTAAQNAAQANFLKTGLEELSARRAELYLLSRSVLQRLGEERSWSVGWESIPGAESGGEFQDVDLDSSSQSISKQPAIMHGIDNLLLRTALNEMDDFYRLFETLTDKSLRHFTVANRFQFMQANIADIAVLKYFQKDYASASTYFYRMVPFYGEEGWSQIELAMLVMYVKCLKELQRKEEYVRAVLKLLAKGALSQKGKLSKKAASSTLDGIDLSGYLSDLLKLLVDLDHEVQVSLQSFFGQVEVAETTIHHKSQDSFSLRLRFQYLQLDELEVNKIRVRLVPSNNTQGREIWFECKEPVIFSQGIVEVQVESNVIIPGYYVANQIVMQSNKMNLKYEAIGKQSEPDDFLKSPRLLLYQHPNAIDIKLSASRYMHLAKNRTLELDLSTGWNNITKCELHVRAATAGLRLQTSEAQAIEGSVKLQKTSDAGSIKFDKLAEYSSVKLRMPYNLEREVNDITLRIDITYTTDNGTFVFSTSPSVSILLPLGVNVQDVFKHKALLSRFTISSSTSSPLRLLSSSLEGSDTFEATTRGGQGYPLIVYPRQPASLLYRITRNAGASVNPKKKQNSLSLTLFYICLEEEINLSVSQALAQALKDTPLYQYARLLTQTVLNQIHSRLSPQDMERAAILGELSTSFISAIHWRDYFVGLSRDLRNSANETASLLEQWLHDWHAQTPSISLSMNDIEKALPHSHSIIIPVDIPSIDVVFTADFQYKTLAPVDDEIVALTNQPANLTLIIKWTRDWNTSNANTANMDLEFSAEVTAPSDFLVGGRRKLHFIVPGAEDAHSEVKLPIMLIPLKEGYFQFPHLEIKPVNRHEESEDSQDILESKLKSTVTCETDYKNSAETIRVVSNARKTTVSLDASGPQGGAWLLESEKWGVEEERAVAM